MPPQRPVMMMQLPRDLPVAIPAAYAGTAGAAGAAVPKTKNSNKLADFSRKQVTAPSQLLKSALHQALRKYRAGHSALTS